MQPVTRGERKRIDLLCFDNGLVNIYKEKVHNDEGAELGRFINSANGGRNMKNCNLYLSRKALIHLKEE